MKPSERR